MIRYLNKSIDLIINLLNQLKKTNLYNKSNLVQKVHKVISSIQFIRFFIIGISTFILDFVLLSLIIVLFQISSEEHLKQTLANIISSAVAIVVNYAIQRNWAFESKNKNVAKEAGKFIAVHIFNLTVYQTILFSVVNYFLPAWLTKILVTAVQIASSFVLYKLFVFKTKITTKEEIEDAVAGGLV